MTPVPFSVYQKLLATQRKSDQNAVFAFFYFQRGRLSDKHNAPQPAFLSGTSSCPGSLLAPLIKYAFTFSQYRYGSLPRTIPHSIISAADPVTNGTAIEVPVRGV